MNGLSSKSSKNPPHDIENNNRKEALKESSSPKLRYETNAIDNGLPAPFESAQAPSNGLQPTTNGEMNKDFESSRGEDEDGGTSIVENNNMPSSPTNNKKLDDMMFDKAGTSKLQDIGLVPNLEEFLNIKVSFLGQNIEKSIRKVISFARVILQKPKLLLMYEETASWGNGVQENLEILRKWSPETTILSITRSNKEILCYDYIILLDGGMIIDNGDPKKLILEEASHFCSYLKETDSETFKYLKEKLNHNMSPGHLQASSLDHVTPPQSPGFKLKTAEEEKSFRLINKMTAANIVNTIDDNK